MQDNGSRTTDFQYVSHWIDSGKPRLNGLPAVYVENKKEVNTLEITLFDDLQAVYLILSYTVYNDRDVITRNVQLVNEDDADIMIRQAYSCCMEFRDHDFTLLHLHGTANRKIHLAREKLQEGSYYIESPRGTSSHVHNPFIALARDGITENSGEIYGMNLVYSGNFKANLYIDQYGLNITGEKIR